MTARVIESLSFLAEAPNGVDRLRSFILELAVAGRLLASDGEAQEFLIDEFCSVQGGIQKTPLRSPVKHHFPYLRVANVQRGRIDVSSLERYELLPEELDRWRLASGDLLIVEGNGSESEIGRCAIWRGEVPDCVFQNHLMRVRPGPQASVDFLALYLNSPVGTAHMRRLAITTSGLFNLSVGKIRSIPVRLPAIAEQQRIVDKVDDLMDLCDRLEARQHDAEAAHGRLVQALLDSLTQVRDADELHACWCRLARVFPEALATEASVEQLRRVVQQLGVMGRLTSRAPADGLGVDLLAKITSSRSKVTPTARKKAQVDEVAREVPFDLPAEWCWSTAEQVCEVIVDCPHSTPKFVPSGVLCLDTNSVKQGRIVPERTRYVEESTYAERVARLTPRAGDVVFAREGSVGESVVIPANLRCCLGQRVMLFRPCLVEPAYLQLALSEPSAVARQLAMHKGIGAKHVNVADMRAAWVPLPPLSEQLRIVAKVTELLALCDQLKVCIAAARAKHAQLAQALVEAAVA